MKETIHDLTKKLNTIKILKRTKQILKLNDSNEINLKASTTNEVKMNLILIDF